MSIRAVTWALDEVRGLDQGQKLVLISLADFANEEHETWHSRERLARRSECSVRTVARHLKGLEDLGLIERRPFYRWCDRDNAKCAARGAHKHRAGTVYRLNIELGEVDVKVLGDRSGNASLESVRSVGSSTCDKLSHVEKTAESQGKSHKCQFVTCGATGDKSGRPQVPELCPPFESVNPQLNPHLPPNPLRRSRRRPGGSVGVKQEDQDFVNSCLPREMKIYSRSAIKKLLPVLRQLVGSGWNESQIAEELGKNPLPAPDQMRSREGLICHRVSNLSGIVPPAGGGRHATPPVFEATKEDPEEVRRRQENFAKKRQERDRLMKENPGMTLAEAMVEVYGGVDGERDAI